MSSSSRPARKSPSTIRLGAGPSAERHAPGTSSRLRRVLAPARGPQMPHAGAALCGDRREVFVQAPASGFDRYVLAAALAAPVIPRELGVALGAFRRQPSERTGASLLLCARDLYLRARPTVW